MFSASLYRIHSEGIFRTGAGGTRNARQTRVRGLELGLQRKFEFGGGRFDACAYYTWQSARQRDRRNGVIESNAVDSVD